MSTDKLKGELDASRKFLELAEQCGARITGKPDGSEPIEIVFSIPAWRKFDATVNPAYALLREAADNLALHAQEYSHRGPPDLIARIEAYLKEQPK